MNMLGSPGTSRERLRRHRTRVAVIALLVLLGGLSLPVQALTITQNVALFGCEPGRLVVDVPNDTFIADGWTWWIPVVWSWDANAQQWIFAGYGDYHYSYGLGVWGFGEPDVRAMTNYVTKAVEEYHYISVTPGYYYAVDNYVYSNGAWSTPQRAWIPPDVAGQSPIYWSCLA